MKRFLQTLTLLFFLFSGTTLFAQPANDNCVDAVTVMLDEVVSFTTIDATMDGVNHAVCLGDNDSIPADVWFVWTAPATGGYNWSNCGTADYDSRVAVYENAASCPPTDAELIACNDDGDASCTSNTSSVNFVATAGNTYTLRMGGFSDDPASMPTTGTGTAVVTALPEGPENDFCINATPIDLGTDQSFVTLNAIIDGPSHPDNSSCFGFGFNTIEGDVWYTYTAGITGTVEWNTCGLITFDSRMAVYTPGSPCPPADEDLYACNDDSGCPNFHSTLIFEVEEGETYLLRLGGYQNEFGNGTFDLVEIVPPVPPVNDLCENATEAFVISAEDAEAFNFGTFQGTTINGTAEADFLEPTCFGGNPGGDWADVWYTFDNLTNTSVEIRFSPSTPDAVFYVDVYDGCGSQLAETVVGSCFTNEPLTDIVDTLVGIADVPDNYLIRVTTRLTTEVPGDFFLQIVGEDFIVATEELAAVENINVYPNPVSDVMQMDIELAEKTDLSISLMNSIGSTVYSSGIRSMDAGRHTENIDMSNLASGIYFISLSDGIHSKVEKVVKL